MAVLARVEVLNHKPDLMFLVDTSSTMTDPINPADPDCKQADGGVCGGAYGPCDTSRCPTRWSEVQAAMGTFLSQNGTLARLGLGTYPDPSRPVIDVTCGPSSSLRVALPAAEDDATLVAKTSEVNAALQGIRNYDPAGNMPTGGSPTAGSLRYVSSLPELRTTERADFVLLLTDGPSNCNPNHPTPYPNMGCRCTLSPEWVCGYAPYDNLGCLDEAASVSAIQELRSQGIRTLVVGFGPDATSATGYMTQATLSAMASAGGFGVERPCGVAQDCGVGDSCDYVTRLCRRQFYPASNGAELASVLQLIGEKLAKDSCLVRLETSGGSPSQESLQVSLDGTVVAPGPDSWSLMSEGVRFTGTACEKIAAARPTAPVVVEVRAMAPH